MHDIRVIVTGSRGYADHELIERTLGAALATAERQGRRLALVHGGAPSGADFIAAKWASAMLEARRSIVVFDYPASFHKLGRAAGPVRNAQMAKDGAVACLAFWDGISRGTLSMIGEASKNHIPVIIIKRTLPIVDVVSAIISAAA